MSKLDSFRKQAKQLVRWHREGNYSVGGRIRSLSRYRELTDAAALALRFPAGVEIHGRLKKEPWGGSAFSVSDPDGNHIYFTWQPTD